jgi:hypothetical protein
MLEFIGQDRPCRAISQTFNIQESKALITLAHASGDIILKCEECRLATNVEVRASADDLEYRIRKCQITTTENTPERP